MSGIDGDGTLLDFDYHEIRVGQAVMENSRKVFLVADHSKLKLPAASCGESSTSRGLSICFGSLANPRSKLRGMRSLFRFNREAMVRLCNIREMDALFTDEMPSEEIREIPAAADVQLHVATEPPSLKVKSPKATRYK